MHMTSNFSVIEVAQEYLDWATKLRQARRTDAAPVTREEVGQYAVQSPDGEIIADGFPDRAAAEQFVDSLTSDDGSGGLLFADSFADHLAEKEGDNLSENEWCRALVDDSGTRGIKKKPTCASRN
jgi:hypothetical protein